MIEYSKPVQVGGEAPDFYLTDYRGSTWRLSEHRGKVVLLLFYPGNETLVCTKQLCSVRDNWSKYMETRAEIVAISASDDASNEMFAAKHRLPVPILADADRAVTRAYIAHAVFPLSFMRGITVVDSLGIVRTHQTMLRAFRPDDHDVILRLYQARSDAIEDGRNILRDRVRRLLLH